MSLFNRTRLNTPQVQLVLAVILLTIALGYDHLVYRNTDTALYAKQLEKNLKSRVEACEAVLNDTAFLWRLLNGNLLEQIRLEKDLDALQYLSQQPWAINIFKGDSLVFWTNKKIVLSPGEFASLDTSSQYKLLPSTYKSELVIQSRFKDQARAEYQLIGILPIKFEYEISSKYLPRQFVDVNGVPESIRIKPEGPGTPVYLGQKNAVFWMDSSALQLDKWRLKTVLFLYVLAFICLAAYFNTIANRMSKVNARKGLSFLIMTAMGVAFTIWYFDATARFEPIEIFRRNMTILGVPSLGDLLIAIGLLTWITLFIHARVPLGNFSHLHVYTRRILTFKNYLAASLFLILTISIYREIVMKTDLNFENTNFLNIQTEVLIAILLLLTVFLYCYRAVLINFRIGLSTTERWYAIIAAQLIAIIIGHYSNLMLPNYAVLLGGFVFIGTFELSLSSNVPKFTLVFLWLLVLSFLPTILLFKYSAFKDQSQRLKIAAELSILRDTFAEKSLVRLRNNVVNELNTKPIDMSTKAPQMPYLHEVPSLYSLIDRWFVDDNYLLYNYTYRLNFSIPKTGEQDSLAHIEQKRWNILNQHFEESIVCNHEDLRFWNNNEGGVAYLINIEPSANVKPDAPRLFITVERKQRGENRVYSELLIERPYKNLTYLKNYNFAIYQHDRLIMNVGGTYGSHLVYEDKPKPGEFIELMHNQVSELIYVAHNGNVVIISKPRQSLKDLVSVFAFALLIIILCALVFTAINTSFGLVKQFQVFPARPMDSLSGRFNIYIFIITFASFLAVGAVTAVLQYNQSKDYHEKRLARKSGVIIRDMQIRLQEYFDLLDTVSTDKMGNLIASLSEIHRSDLNLYNLQGRLIATSEPDIFERGISPPFIHPVAFKAFTQLNQQNVVKVQESLGTLDYQSSYAPLKVQTVRGEKLVGFLEVPYYFENSNLRDEILISLSSLVTLYVFLLILAGYLAFRVVNSVTKPLADLNHSLSTFQLGKDNKRLVWQRNDEIGQLVKQYNKLISELDDAAQKLKAGEREGAWREMAKQVAHEIKNPLTPMKLSVQYLQTVSQRNPAMVEKTLERVTTTLVEQIDNLANVVTEFSTLARMPTANNQLFALNNLMANVIDLNSRQAKVEVFCEVPKDEIIVFADRDQIWRVITNLVQNAVQAIPADREGRVYARLYTRNNMAIVQVSDNGCGIPQEKLARVFEPNFTTKTTGTGLGLAISKNIVETSNGKIWLESIQDVGTDFYIELPLVEIRKLAEFTSGA